MILTLYSERNLSLTVGLKVLCNEYRPCKEELRQSVDLLARNSYFNKSLTPVGGSCVVCARNHPVELAFGGNCLDSNLVLFT